MAQRGKITNFRIGKDGIFTPGGDVDFSKLPPGTIRFVVLVILALIGLIVLFGCFYRVEADETGIIRRFGKFVREEGPGLHVKIPLIEDVATPKVQKLQRLEIGFVTLAPGRFKYKEEEALMLTGDENIVSVEFIVQYKISDAKNFLFEVQDVREALRDAAESAMRGVVGSHLIDEVLTAGKEQMQSQAQDLIQEIANLYGSGLRIVAVQLQDVHPPKHVIHSFKDVASAKEDKNKMINEAQGYRNDLIPKARGLAAANLEAALAYKEERIARATGDASKFLKVLKEYTKAKTVTRQRMYLENMEKALARAKVYLIEDEGNGQVLSLLSLNDGDARGLRRGGK